jgi:hypothetical protein
MAFGRFRSSFGSRPPILAASRPLSRNDLVAERERLHAQEQRLARQIDLLRSRQDDLSNQLMRPNPTLAEVGAMMDREVAQRPLDAAAGARLISQAGDRARSGAPVPLPPKGSTARLIVVAGMKARNEKIPDGE